MLEKRAASLAQRPAMSLSADLGNVDMCQKCRKFLKKWRFAAVELCQIGNTADTYKRMPQGAVFYGIQPWLPSPLRTK
jgi:hypothetical protein